MAVDVPIPMLTRLKASGHNFRPPTSAGNWVASGSSLGELSKALDVDPDAKVDRVKSTPDPWAQLRSFADTLLDPTLDDAAVVGEWRALIAIFALSAANEDSYRLKFQPVELRASNSRFASVMLHLLPRTTLPLPPAMDDVSAGWDRPVIVRLVTLDANGQEKPDARPLALLNPASLVAPGRNAENWRCDAVPWLKSGLVDPLSLQGAQALSSGEVALLAGYLRQLDSNLAALSAGRGTPVEVTLLAQLRRRIDDFHKDCLAALPGDARDGTQFDVGEPLDGQLPTPYRLLATPLQPKARQPGFSECIIALRHDLTPPPFKGVILLDPALATDQKPANKLIFWELKTLQQAISAPESERRALAAAIAKAGYLMVTPDDLFTRTLVRLNEEDQPGQVVAHPDRLRDHLLPFSPLLLLILTPDEIVNRIELNRDGRVTLQLPVSGRSHKLSQRYATTPNLGEGKLVENVDWGFGDFAIWPNFSSPRWHHYCARLDYSANVLQRLRGRFALSGAMINRQLNVLGQETDRAAAAAGWAWNRDHRGFQGLDPTAAFADRVFNAHGIKRLRARNTAGNVSEVLICEEPFEAAFFTIALAADSPSVPAGLALLHIARIDNVGDQPGDVAIDFGTTNTVACLNDTEPALLTSRIFHPIKQSGRKSGSQLDEIGQKFRDFLPPDARKLPTPTVIIARELDTPATDLLDNSENMNDLLLFRHLIYFQPDFAADGTIEAVKIDAWTSLIRRLRFDLKWAAAPVIRDAARRYLRQLMLMLAAEWAAGGGDPRKLRWHFSRPRNMGDDQDFLQSLHSALADVVPGHRPDAIPALVYEGDAAATFILTESNKDRSTKDSGTKGRINIILDIGGGTTDIAIWSGGGTPRRLLSSSLRLAGGDFFTGYITENPEILSDFDLKPWTSIVSQLKQEKDVDVRANVRYVGELLFSGETLGNAIDKQWSRVSGTERVRRLKETAFVFLGGIAWHIGWQLKQLIRAGDLTDEDLKDISVALCGRGSGLFTRLHGKDPHASTEISRLLRLVAVAAGDVRPALPQIKVSPFPKIEVAAGMIIAGRATRDNPVPKAGHGTADPEDFSDVYSTNDNQAFGNVADSGDGSFTAAAPDIGIDAFEPFLRAFKIAAGCEITFDPRQRSKLQNTAAEMHALDERDGRPPQSEFADILKAFVEMMRSRPEPGLRPQTRWR